MMAIRKKRTTQQIDRAGLNGRRRWCPSCQEMIGTQRGRFNQHGSTMPGKEVYCRMSGEKVGAPVPTKPKPMPRRKH